MDAATQKYQQSGKLLYEQGRLKKGDLDREVLSYKLLQYFIVVYETPSAGYEKAVREPILRLTPERQLENKANIRLISRALKMALRIQEVY
ncbi:MULTISPECIES: hypothetical protein [Nitrosomonas]|uniref:Uncharacterized protein n=1 Tax=Nitrosomonas communis TaxID=44574 RepID=A0A0F7KDK6_9PROT|nr:MULTISPECIES: hypothetical protein [Nitrosomonas]AKH38640.1 hypothetical protein AAW31_13845 [Nitrosomonas communis]TYP83736.1 hypothetical protein BCL69_104210 [Nitrosomonas communis]UVS60709.1 hypothetical protein NX761_14570 [Nitrosomonas sp. PLL12]